MGEIIMGAVIPPVFGLFVHDRLRQKRKRIKLEHGFALYP